MGYKLLYFNVRGRAQSLRYLCADNDIHLEEEVIAFGDWPKVKPTTPLGQAPVLKDGTFELAQSNAILRYVAKKHGLYGKDDQEAALIDMVNDQQEDMRLLYLRLIYREYDTGKEAFIKDLPNHLAVFEKLLGKNASKDHFVGSKTSFVDYTIFDLLDNLVVLTSTALDTFPLLKAFHSKWLAHEKIAKFRSTDTFKNMPINGNGKQ